MTTADPAVMQSPLGALARTKRCPTCSYYAAFWTLPQPVRPEPVQ